MTRLLIMFIQGDTSKNAMSLCHRERGNSVLLTTLDVLERRWNNFHT